MMSDGHSDERRPPPAGRMEGARTRSAYPAGNFIRRAVLTCVTKG
jgi:hypothetical protein